MKSYYRVAVLVAVLTLITSAVSARAAERRGGPWELVKENRQLDIRVFTREVEGGAIREFRATTRVRTSLSSLVALFEDTDNLHNWVHRVVEVRIPRRESKTEVYAYTVMNAPWPLKNRDVVIHTKLTQNPRTLDVVIAGEHSPGFLPEDERYVRLPEMDTDWTFHPLGGGLVEVTFRGYGNPGGVVPAWAANLVMTDMPYGSMKGLLRQIGKEKYQSVRYEFIKEPRP